MRLHKFVKILCPVLALTLLTGCSGIKEKIKDAAFAVIDKADSAVEENARKDPRKGYAMEKFDRVFELVQKKDCEAVLELFSEYNKSKFDMLSDIEILVDFMDGEIVEKQSVKAELTYGIGKTEPGFLTDGYTVRMYVTTDKGTTYLFKVGVTARVDRGEERRLGVDRIYILNSDIFDEYMEKRREWRNNSSSETEPERPDNMEVGVLYFDSQKQKYLPKNGG